MDCALKIGALLFLVYGWWSWRTTLGSTPVDMFEQWIAQHGRAYEDKAEKLYRLGVFTRNMEHVNAFLQAGGRSYTIGLNRFADLTKEEFLSTYATGRMRPSDASYPGLQPFRYVNMTAPSSIDWRNKGAVTPVKDQATCGKDSSSCSSSIPIQLII